MKNTYTSLQIIKLMEYRAKNMDETYDDIYSSEKDIFLHAGNKFAKWLAKMEEQGKIEYILSVLK